MMGNAVEQSSCHLGVAKHLHPLAERQIRGDDQPNFNARTITDKVTLMSILTNKFNITIEFGEAILLKNLNTEENRLLLNISGVYLLLKAKESSAHQDQNASAPIHLCANVFYIGKACAETIFSRAKKHIYSIRGDLNRNGNPRARPGRNFRAFREQVNNSLEDLWLVPGFMPNSRSFEISCAEEWLIFEYRTQHVKIPAANTYAARDLLPNAVNEPPG